MGAQTRSGKIMDGPELLAPTKPGPARTATIARPLPVPLSTREPRVSQTTLTKMLVPAGVPALAGLQSSFQGPTRADLKDNSDGPAKAGTPTSLPPSPIPMGEGSQLDTQDAADDARFPFFTAAQLNSGQFETRYLIPGILAAAQPGGIYGAFKTLKTSLTADLLISLASGT